MAPQINEHASFGSLDFSGTVSTDEPEQWHRISVADKGDLLLSSQISADAGTELKIEVFNADGLPVEAHALSSHSGDHQYWQLQATPGDYFIRFEHDPNSSSDQQSFNTRVALAPAHDIGGGKRLANLLDAAAPRERALRHR